MDLRYADNKPVVRCNKTEQRHLASARDSLRSLAHVEEGAKQTLQYLDELIKRIGEDGIVRVKSPAAPQIARP